MQDDRIWKDTIACDRWSNGHWLNFTFLTRQAELYLKYLGHGEHTEWRNELRFLVRIEEWIAIFGLDWKNELRFWSGLKEWNAILVQIEEWIAIFGQDWGINWHAMYVRRDPDKQFK